MSAAVTPARRLLAMLEEEPSLETRPRDEIDADLAVLGIDPAGPIRVARQLATENAGPAASLLGAMIDDESAEAEIAALESADIDEIRGRLQTGTVAAVTAEAQRRAGLRSNVVGIARRRRGTFWTVTGSVVGMAACALIVVAVWWPPSGLDYAPELLQSVVSAPETAERRTAGSESDPALADSSIAANIAPPPLAESAPMAAASEPSPVLSREASPMADQEQAGSARSDDAESAPAAMLSAVPQAVPPSMAGARLEPADPMAEKLGEQELDASGAGDAPPLPPPIPTERQAMLGALSTEEPAIPDAAGFGESSVAPDGSLRSRTAPSQSPDGAPVAQSEGFVADLLPQLLDPSDWAAQVSVTDVLVVDSTPTDLAAILAPAPGMLHRLENRVDALRPARTLSGRTAEAQRLAEGLPIVALLRLRLAGTEFDTVLLRTDPGVPSADDDPMRPLLTRWFGDRASDFSLISLSPGP